MRKRFNKYILGLTVLNFGLLFNLIGQQQMPPYGDAGLQVGVSVSVDNGFNYGYFEYLPVDFAIDAQQTYPLIIFFHGLGEKGDATYSEGSGTYSVDTGLKRIVRKPKRSNGELLKNEQGEIQYYLRNEDPPSMINAGSKSFPAIVISPQSRRGDGQFTPSDFEEIFEFITSEYPVDLNRIYITGLSAGGGSTWKAMRSKYADQLAAAIPICGAGSVADPSEHLQQTAIWTHHNFNDGIVGKGNTISNVDRITNISSSCMEVYPYNSGSNAADRDITMHFDAAQKEWKATTGIDAPKQKLAFTLYNTGGHNAWKKTYENQAVWDWLFSQTLGEATTPINAEPTANAGEDQSLNASETLLNGSDSKDDSGITSYLWRQTAGDQEAVIATTNGVITEVNGLKEGVYEFVLTVQDAEGAFDSDTLIIRNSQQSNYISIHANDPAGERIYLYRDAAKSNGNQIDFDYPNNDNLSFVIRKDQAALFNWDKLFVGLTIGYQSQEIALSSFIQNVSDEWIYVSIPLASFNHNLSKLTEGGISNFYLLARSNFGSGVFYLDEIKIDGGQTPLLWYGDEYSLSAESSSVEHSGPNFVLQARVDKSGYTAFNLGGTSNQVPQANAGVDQTISGTSATLSGNKSIDDQDGLQYLWIQTAGPQVALSNPEKVSMELINLIPATYTFSLTVTDVYGETETDEVTLIVSSNQESNSWLRVNADYPAGEWIYMFYDGEKSNSNEQDTGYPENDMLTFKIRANNESEIFWSNLNVGLTIGYQTREKPLSDYIDNIASGEWTTIDIPLSSLGHDLTKLEKRGVSGFVLNATGGLGNGYFEIDEIVFTGGNEPFLWYGDAYQASGDFTAIEITSNKFNIESLATASRDATESSVESLIPNITTDSVADKLSVKESVVENLEVTVYPNPSSGIFVINTGSSGATFVLDIYNHSGRLIYNSSFDGSQKINMIDQPAGMYMLLLQAANGQSWIKRLIIE